MAKSILTADDSISIRQLLRYVLEGAGYGVVDAVDGKDALAKLAVSPVHLIITDLHMPNLDGLELIKAVRASPAHRFTPCLMVTTETHDDKRQAGRAAGATGWIVKPFVPDQLLAIVKKLIG